ncbi:cyclin-like protein [Pavlovales sp. CCMP2436]|nr:cyclin-like protein [Pavlovales sp. CCMP2436]
MDAPDAIDLADSNDAQCVVPYIKDIMRCMRETEGKYLAPPTYMAQQTDINEKMRAILIDWLIEVHLKFKLVPETMYVTVNLIDRFLAKKSVQRNKLQLVGVTAMFIASKYEEIYAPEVRDFVYISDKAYTREEILKMEGTVLGVLSFNVTAPSPYSFLKRFVKIAGWLHPDQPAVSREEQLCSYLTELTLQEYRMLKYLPSVIAASAVCLAQKMLNNGHWTSALQQHTCYPEATLLPCMKDMNAIVKAAAKNTLIGVRKKYSQEKYNSVGLILPVEL